MEIKNNSLNSSMRADGINIDHSITYRTKLEFYLWNYKVEPSIFNYCSALNFPRIREFILGNPYQLISWQPCVSFGDDNFQITSSMSELTQPKISSVGEFLEVITWQFA